MGSPFKGWGRGFALQGLATMMMGTLKLLWFFLWRMSLSGPILGAVLGAIYGILLALVVSLYAILMLSTSQGPEEPTATNILAALVLPMVYGVFLGILAGVPIGLVLGLLDGLILGVLTRAFYYPTPTSPRRYRTVAGTVCVAANVLVHFAVGSYLEPQAGLGTFFGAWFLDVVLFVIVPPLIATLAMSLLGVLVAAWYVHTVQRVAGSGEGMPAPGEHPEVG